MTNILHKIMSAVCESDKIAACLRLCDVMDIGDVILLDDSTLDNIESYVRQKCLKMSIEERGKYLDNDVIHSPQDFMFSPAVRQRVLNVCATINNAHKCMSMGFTSKDRALYEVVRQFIGIMSESQRMSLLNMTVERARVDGNNRKNESDDVIYKKEYLEDCERVENDIDIMQVSVQNQCRNLSVLESMAQEFLPSIHDIIIPERSILSAPEVLIKLEKLYGDADSVHDNVQVSNPKSLSIKIHDSRTVTDTNSISLKDNLSKTGNKCSALSLAKDVKFSKSLDSPLSEYKHKLFCKKKSFITDLDNKSSHSSDLVMDPPISRGPPKVIHLTSKSMKEVTNKVGKAKRKKESRKDRTHKAENVSLNKSSKSLDSLISSIISSKNTDYSPAGLKPNQSDVQKNKKPKRTFPIDDLVKSPIKYTDPSESNKSESKIQSQKIEMLKLEEAQRQLQSKNKKSLIKIISEADSKLSKKLSRDSVSVKEKTALFKAGPLKPGQTKSKVLSVGKSTVKTADNLSTKESSLTVHVGPSKECAEKSFVSSPRSNQSLIVELIKLDESNKNIVSKQKSLFKDSDKSSLDHKMLEISPKKGSEKTEKFVEIKEVRNKSPPKTEIVSKIFSLEVDIDADQPTKSHPESSGRTEEAVKPDEPSGIMQSRTKASMILDDEPSNKPYTGEDIEAAETLNSINSSASEPAHKLLEFEDVQVTDQSTKETNQESLNKTSSKETSSENNVEIQKQSQKYLLLTFGIEEEPMTGLLKVEEPSIKIQTIKDKIFPKESSLEIDTEAVKTYSCLPKICSPRSDLSPTVELIKLCEKTIFSQKKVIINKFYKTSSKETVLKDDLEVEDHSRREATLQSQQVLKDEVILVAEQQRKIGPEKKDFTKISNNISTEENISDVNEEMPEKRINDQATSSLKTDRSPIVKLLKLEEPQSKAKSTRKSIMKKCDKIPSEETNSEVEEKTEEKSQSEAATLSSQTNKSSKIELQKLEEPQSKAKSTRKSIMKKSDKIPSEETNSEVEEEMEDKSQSEAATLSSQTSKSSKIELQKLEEPQSKAKSTRKSIIKKCDKISSKEINLEIEEETEEKSQNEAAISSLQTNKSSKIELQKLEEPESKAKYKKKSIIKKSDNIPSEETDTEIEEEEEEKSQNEAATSSSQTNKSPKIELQKLEEPEPRIRSKRTTAIKASDKIYSKKQKLEIVANISDKCKDNIVTSFSDDELQETVPIKLEKLQQRTGPKRRRSLHEPSNTSLKEANSVTAMESPAKSKKVFITRSDLMIMSQQTLQPSKVKEISKKNVDQVSKNIKVEYNVNDVQLYYERIGEVCQSHFVRAAFIPEKHYAIILPEESQTAKKRFAYLVCYICKNEQRNNHQIKFNLTTTGSPIVYKIVQHLKIHFRQKK